MIYTRVGGPLLALVAVVSLTAAAPPPPTPMSADPEATVADEFVVRGRLPGPAWWKVSRGDSKVYVLGMPGARACGVAAGHRPH